MYHIPMSHVAPLVNKEFKAHMNDNNEKEIFSDTAQNTSYINEQVHTIHYHHCDIINELW